MPEFTVDWTSAHFENWAEWTKHLRDRACAVLEIGSHEGQSALWWLENLPKCNLTCVDPWDWSLYPQAYDTFKQNTLKYWGTSRLTVFKGHSRRVLPTMRDGLFDVIYVDGDHEGRSACLDVLMSVDLLRVGGVLIVDDYEWDDADRWVKVHPRVGTDQALMLNYDRLEVFHRGYQIAARRVA
jgi:predicted O-methyltransferase YrrM